MVYTDRKRSSSDSRRSRPSGRRSGTYSLEQGSQCTLGGEELKRLKEKQAKRKEIRYIQSRTGVTVYIVRRRSSSGSRRSRPRARKSGT